MTRPSLDLDRSEASPSVCALIAELVAAIRPDWDPRTTSAVLLSHRGQATAGELAVAALRAAMTSSLPGPRAIGWRGPHWDHVPARRRPGPARESSRCLACGKPEARCYSERFADDDHAYEPSPIRVPVR